MNTTIMASSVPTILFFNINGNGLGHMSRCLAYARRLKDRAQCVFFSNAAAIEIIHEMGFQADYFVSPFSSRASGGNWNRQLVRRFGLILERVRPDVVVFDGSWPFQGMLDAIDAYGARYRKPKVVWSRRGLHKKGTIRVPVDERIFDLVIEPGELGTRFDVARPGRFGRKIVVPPVALLDDHELLDREGSRAALGLERDERYALFSLGPGNLKDVAGIGQGLIELLRNRGFKAVWAYAPISVRDVPLPDHAMPLEAYPLPRYMKGFDLFVGAAGYNTCCEVLQTRVPSLLVPNLEVIDDQTRRAELVAENTRAVISPCETVEQRTEAIARVVALATETRETGVSADTSGAGLASDEIMSLVMDDAGV